MHKLTLFGLSLVMTACLTAKTTTDTEEEVGGTASYATIVDIQSGTIAEGETVTLQNVIVTSNLTGDEEGFFIQDEGGGEWSGIYVFVGQAGGGIAPMVGDKLNITGSVSEFYDSTQLVISSSENLVVTGEGDVVATTVSSVTDWETYEGCLISLDNQTVDSDVNSYGEVDLSFGIPMDNTFFNFETCFEASYDSIVGIVTYSFEEYKLNPRSQDDLMGSAEGECEATMMTVAEVQSGDYENRTVSFENVVVTEAESDFDGYSVFWIQDQGAGDWSGLYVFVRENTATEITVNRGDVVNLTGMVEERYEQTQLVLNDAADFTAVSSDGDITSVSLSEAPADWEMYEGVLVSLESAELGTGGEYGQYPVSNYGGLLLDDELYEYSVSDGDTFASLTGLVFFSYGEFTLLPRDEMDVTGQETGNDDGDGDDNGNTGTPVVATMEELRDGTHSVGDAVTISGAIVTNVGSSSMYLQDPVATSNGAIIVYFGSDTLTATEGDEVTVTGELEQFYDVLQISSVTDFSVTGTGTITPLVLTTTPSDWEMYESMMVEVQNVEVTAGPDQYGSFDTNFGISLSDYWNTDLSTGVTIGTSYTITGFVNHFYSNYELLTRDNSDIVE
jgi:predicted extracellular nuclease